LAEKSKTVVPRCSIIERHEDINKNDEDIKCESIAIYDIMKL
jgi:hypothetical protein